MQKMLVIAGLTVIVIGIVLLGIFPGAFYKSANTVNSNDYKDGTKITVYGVITREDYSPLINKTAIELDGNLTVYVNGNFTKYKVGDSVYMSIMKTSLIQFGDWKVSAWTSNPRDIHSVANTQLYFYILIAIGVIIAILGVIIR